MLYQLLNYFFFVFHTVLMVFNTFGWIWARTRRWNLVTLLLTAFSWFVLGIWYGWGYCFCTDWHWNVREHLGYHDMTESYVQFLILKLTGIDLPVKEVNIATVVIFFVSLAMSIFLNIKERRSKLHHS